MIELEGAEAARATASGMAAVTAAMLAPGEDRRSCGRGEGDVRLLPLHRRGFAAALRHRVDAGRWADLDPWRNAMRPNTKAFFLESPSNPTLELIDIAAVAEIAHAAGARLIVDNVFATPIWQRPLALGADVVVYSATKHIDGQGRCLGGVVLGIGSLHRRARPEVPAPDRPVDVAVQCLGDAEGAGDAADARARADGDGGQDRRLSRRPREDLAAALSRPRRPSAGGAGGEADARRLDDDRLRGRRAARPARSVSSTR